MSKEPNKKCCLACLATGAGVSGLISFCASEGSCGCHHQSPQQEKCACGNPKMGGLRHSQTMCHPSGRPDYPEDGITIISTPPQQEKHECDDDKGNCGSHPVQPPKVEKIEIIEKIDRTGRVFERLINGVPYPPDEYPSFVIFENVKSVEQHFFLSPMEAKKKYGYGK